MGWLALHLRYIFFFSFCFCFLDQSSFAKPIVSLHKGVEFLQAALRFKCCPWQWVFGDTCFRVRKNRSRHGKGGVAVGMVRKAGWRDGLDWANTLHCMMLSF